MMLIDFTTELLPLLWALLGLLMIAAGAIIANVDPEVAELYVGDRRLLIVTAALVAVTFGALVAAGPEIATDLGLAFH